MTTVIMDPQLERRVRAERAATGADRYDEVWEGTYMMAPMPNVEHQDIVSGFAAVFQELIRWPGLGLVMPGANVSDREDGWEENYRVPDVAVFLHDGEARNCGTHWRGGPDFAVEIVSPHDQTREKLAFYGSVGVVELLVVDRVPWQLELYRNEDRRLILAGRTTLQRPVVLDSIAMPVALTLSDGPDRPQIEVRHTQSERAWMI